MKLYINTGNAKFIMKRSFSGMSLSDQECLKVELKKMLDADIIISAMHS